MAEKIRPGCRVTMRYDMKTRLPDGEVKERRGETAEFLYGVESQVPALEQALEGAEAGDRIVVQIPESELYGEHDPGLIREIPKSGLIKQRIKEGQYYRQMRRGSLVSFKVLEVRPETVVADFNEPMAGISVSMELEVTEVRQSSEQEIAKAREAEVKRRIGCG